MCRYATTGQLSLSPADLIKGAKVEVLEEIEPAYNDLRMDVRGVPVAIMRSARVSPARVWISLDPRQQPMLPAKTMTMSIS
jgi:hypothetical protein